MLGPIITQVVAFLFPKAPAWVPLFVGEVLPAVFDVVEALEDNKELSGTEKFYIATGAVRDALDEAFDSLPEWGDLDEEQRDRIIDGLVELVLFLQRLSPAGRRKTRTAIRRAVRGVR